MRKQVVNLADKAGGLLNGDSVFPKWIVRFLKWKETLRKTKKDFPKKIVTFRKNDGRLRKRKRRLSKGDCQNRNHCANTSSNTEDTSVHIRVLSSED